MEIQFPSGIRFNNPHEKAPSFVKGKISFKVDEFTQYLKEHQDNNWVNLILKQSKSGNMYFELDTWKPDKKVEKYKSPEQSFKDQQEFYGTTTYSEPTF